MSWNLLRKIIGLAGAALVVCGYYLLWISQNAGISEVITRTKYSIAFDLSGGLMVVFYLYKRHS